MNINRLILSLACGTLALVFVFGLFTRSIAQYLIVSKFELYQLLFNGSYLEFAVFLANAVLSYVILSFTPSKAKRLVAIVLVLQLILGNHQFLLWQLAYISWSFGSFV